ncbi:MAG TPA: tetratricopeptide repeat protein [Pirellulales bacterium]|jgi:tetratricopeptide (TPR) repeat protein|nr:tetratricopeptide repeat protein [Pirellulales bacterium]
MTNEPERSRRKFTGPWDEIKYLRGKLLHWFYERGDRRRAREICRRLAPLLKKVANDRESILRQECWSIVYEVREDFDKAIEHRRREIELMKMLLDEAERSPQKSEILKWCDYSDLSDRLDLLAILYRDAGDLDKAIDTLEDSKRLCRQHRIKFDAQDMLDDYLAERASPAIPLLPVRPAVIEHGASAK